MWHIGSDDVGGGCSGSARSPDQSSCSCPPGSTALLAAEIGSGEECLLQRSQEGNSWVLAAAPVCRRRFWEAERVCNRRIWRGVMHDFSLFDGKIINNNVINIHGFLF